MSTISNTEHYYLCARAFMRAFGQKAYRFISDVPNPVLDLRKKLIAEELLEYQQARAKSSPIDTLDAICDLLYVVAGTMVACGIKAEPYTNSAPRHPFNISAACELVNAELSQAIPCQRRMYRYINSCLKLLEDCGSMYQLRDAFTAVHDNNMAKLWNERPTDKTLIVQSVGKQFLVKNKDGKIIKPSSHVPPDLSMYIPVWQTTGA